MLRIDSVIAATPFADGTTNIGDSLYEAYLDIANAHTDKKYVVLISDGVPNRPAPDSNARQLAYDMASLLKGSGVTIFTIGLDV